MSKAKRAAQAEDKATRKAAKHRDHPLVAIPGKASEIADQPPLIALSIATLLVGAVLRRPAVVRSGVRMLASHALATGIKSIVKSSVDRTRPARAIARGGHSVRKGRGSKDSGLNSFPSGHTAGAVAVAQAIAVDVPAAALPVRLLAGGIGALQLPRGKHYLSDVAVGAVIGWASERIASAVLALGEKIPSRWSDPADVLTDTEVNRHPR